ncbi:MAG: hemerythrin family protein [Desulfovibrionaceae bacterium]|nr:hemerythrin family protein [Desulfovibrionaceae bacterium]
MSETIYSWDERYRIGIDSIDAAHEELFNAVARLHRLIHEQGKDKWACIQGIKFFKSYCLKHFADEEAYMRKKSYIGLEAHQKIHAEMRDVTLPAIELEMREQSYSEESVEHFLHICSEWLANHIIREDHKLIFVDDKV